MAGSRKHNNRKWLKEKAKYSIKVLAAAVLATVIFAAGTLAVSHFMNQQSENSGQADEAVSEDTPVPQGRVILVGDSRTIDMFADSDDPVEGSLHDGILVYARHGYDFNYLRDVMESLQPGQGDTVVSFMGANDAGVFSPYGELYERLLAGGVRLVVCTVGPCGTGNSYENRFYPDYHNENMTAFNDQLIPWADANGVHIIDTYSYIADHLEIDPDGIHYLPRPTSALWEYILDELEMIDVTAVLTHEKRLMESESVRRFPLLGVCCCNRIVA